MKYCYLVIKGIQEDQRNVFHQQEKWTMKKPFSPSSPTGKYCDCFQ